MDETTAPPNERAAHTQGSLGDGRMQFCLTIKRVTGAGSGQNIGKPMDETDNDHGRPSLQYGWNGPVFIRDVN